MNPALKVLADFGIRQKELHKSGGLTYVFLGEMIIVPQHPSFFICVIKQWYLLLPTLIAKTS